MDSNLAAYAAYEAEKRRQAEQQQQNQPNLIDALGKLALGAGAVAAGAYGVRRMLQPGAVAPSKAPPSTATVRRAAGAVPAEVARQQELQAFTRAARAERPQGVRQGNLQDMIKQVKVEDLGPTYSPVSPELAKIDLNFINNVLIPMEQKRLPSATEFLQERLQGQVTKLPSSYYSRTPSTFKEFSSDPGRALLFDIDLLKRVEAEELESQMRLPEMRAEQARQQAQVRRAYSAAAEDVIAAVRKEANTVQAAGQEDFAGQYLRNQGYLEADTLVDQQQGRILGQVDHFANAANSAEDQTTGRVKHAIQRNEDANLAAVEMAEDAVDSQLARIAQQSPDVAETIEVDAAINEAASRLPDGLPVDQAEVISTKPKYIFRERVFEKPGFRLQEEAAKTQRYQTAIPVSIIKGREARLGEMGVPGRFTVLPQGTTTEGTVFTGPSTPTLSADEIASKLAEMQLSQEAQVRNAMARGLSEARARKNIQVTESQRQALEADLPTFSSEDVMSRTGVKGYGSIEEAERFTEEQASKSGKIKALEEGGFLEEQVDPGELRVVPRQAQRGVMIRPASKTSYRGMTGRPGVGIYGQQAPGTAGTLDFGPGAVEVSKVIKTEGEERGVTTPRTFIPGADDPAMETPEGFVYTEEAMTQPTQARRYGTRPPTRPEAAREAFDVARQLRQLQQSGRSEEAQAFLDKIMKERDISAIGESQPLRQQMSRRGKFGV